MDVLKSSLPTEQTTQNSKCADFTQTFKIDDERALEKYVKFQRQPRKLMISRGLEESLRLEHQLQVLFKLSLQAKSLV